MFFRVEILDESCSAGSATVREAGLRVKSRASKWLIG